MPGPAESFLQTFGDGPLPVPFLFPFEGSGKSPVGFPSIRRQPVPKARFAATPGPDWLRGSGAPGAVEKTHASGRQQRPLCSGLDETSKLPVEIGVKNETVCCFQVGKIDWGFSSADSACHVPLVSSGLAFPLACWG